MCSWYDTGEEGAEGGSTGAGGSSNEVVRWQRFYASLSEKGYFRVCWFPNVNFMSFVFE